MPFCSKCGAEVLEDVKFCTKCGASIVEAGFLAVELHLADWGKRFVAWLIDVVIVGVIPNVLRLSGVWREFHLWPLEPIPFFDFGLGSVIPFVYWTLVEGYSGRSIGKLVMDLKVTRLDGSKIDFTQAALESFGKAFILPIDCIIGWILDSCKEKRQRVFNKLSNTIVIRVPKEEIKPKGVEYIKDEK